jgi:resolvase-like protein
VFNEGKAMAKPNAPRRAGIYVRVSRDRQAVDEQMRELRQIAEQRGWTVVDVYLDAGISAKGPDKHPGLDSMLMHATRRKFDVVMAWAIDQLGSSLIDLLVTIQHLEATGVHLYLDEQNLDTTTPMGKSLFQVADAFAEFDMIRQRVRVGLGPVNESRPQRQVHFQIPGTCVGALVGPNFPCAYGRKAGANAKRPLRQGCGRSCRRARRYRPSP